MKIIGMLLSAIGVIDFAGSYMEFDLWGGFLGVQLPDLLWKFSPYIEMTLGYFIMNLGDSKEA